ncbi:MAG: hypothetical protein MUE85_02900 [Microscillaceae bacterium]|nr:hypothetical protein [Microscillaceae bacterium]
MAIKNLLDIEKHLFICNGGTCMRNGSEECTAKIREYIKDEGLETIIHTTKTYCNGRCEDAPILIQMPEGIWYKNITPELARKFVRECLVKGKILEDKILFQYGVSQLNSTSATKVD